MIRFRYALVSYLACALTTAAQPPKLKSLNLVSPNGKGRIAVSLGPEVKWQLAALYDDNTRPVVQFQNTATRLDISYVIFPNQTGSAEPKICRDDVLNAAQRSLSGAPGFVDIKQVKKADSTNAAGQPLATGSYFIASLGDMKIAEQNVFGVISSTMECAEVHISKDSYTPADDSAIQSALQAFSFDTDYSPIAQDYYLLGTLLYQLPKNYAGAAVYYQRALDTLPANAPLRARRVITDQLSMSYGISGQIARSRAVNEDAIKLDPDYPLYYYNLACADSEQGKAADAKVHLQRAFDRKANMLAGEHFPDPRQDDSIQKLKKNKEFWAFVQTLK
jgi:tetratricopeptide (TPR) repeat protein